MTCPDDNAIAQLIDGAVDDDERARLEAHLDACDACALLLAELGRAAPVSEVDDTLPAGERVPLEAGATIARFTLLDCLGAGGMGVVWAAYDPQLDRKIALKFVRADLARPDMLERLAREAKALARVSHPNVVAVYDSGREGDRIYIAQEYVRGSDLAHWLAARPRDASDILAVFMQAARGLAAAHASGIVHRDFKPSNVLVGDDGRVRVVDFGVARSADAAPPAPAEPTPQPPASEPRLTATGAAVGTAPASEPRLTATGAAVGTPLYMSPEQHLGERSDARSDQFSFCVSLAEALYGEVPFRGKSAADYAIEVVHGNVRPPPSGSKVPAWLRGVILRGLAGNRDERYASMDALIAALQADPTRARRRRLAIAVAAVAAVAAAAAAVALWPAHRDACTGAPERWTSVWSQQRAGVVHAAFAATTAPVADPAFARVARGLDGYGRDWISAHEQACHATERGEQSAQAMDRRMSCLEHHLQDIAAAADVLAHADRDTVVHADAIVAALPAVADCADATTLAPPPKDRPRIDALRARLATARATERAGRYADARRLADAVVTDARAAAYAPLLADSLLVLGATQSDTGDDRAAEATLRDAYVAAVSAGNSDDSTLAAASLVRVVGLQLARLDDAAWWADVAKAGLATRKSGDRGLDVDVAMRVALYDDARGRYDDARASLQRVLVLVPGDRARQATLHVAIGNVLYDQGKFRESLDEHRRALAIREEVFGHDHPLVAECHNWIGVVLEHLGQYDAALAEHRIALAMQERLLGPDHLDTVGSRSNIAIVLSDQMKAEDAIAEYRRGIAILEAKLGPEHYRVAKELESLTAALRRAGRSADGLPIARRALAIDEKVFGPEHPNTAGDHMNIGAVLEDMQKDDEARVEIERSLAIWDKTLPPNHTNLGLAHNALGAVLLQLDRFAEAEVHLRRALAIFEAALGPDHLNCMGVHDNLGNALHALHRDSDAVEEHRRVFAIIDRAHLAVSPTDRAVFVLHLADALAGAGRIAEARPDLEQVLAHPEQIADPEVRAALARHLAHAKATKTIARAR